MSRLGGDMARDPNKSRERLQPLNPVRRHVDHAETYGPLKEPGYRCVARRPRVASFDEVVTPERADRLEKTFSSMPDMGEY